MLAAAARTLRKNMVKSLEQHAHLSNLSSHLGNFMAATHGSHTRTCSEMPRCGSGARCDEHLSHTLCVQLRHVRAPLSRENAVAHEAHSVAWTLPTATAASPAL